MTFSLRLCREVHRLYGEYHEDRLPPGDSVLAGLMLTAEILTTLQANVTEGMPALRVVVATAQIREILAVLFDEDPANHALRQRYQSIVNESAKQLPNPEGERKRWGGSRLSRWLGRGSKVEGSLPELDVMLPVHEGSAHQAPALPSAS